MSNSLTQNPLYIDTQGDLTASLEYPTTGRLNIIAIIWTGASNADLLEIKDSGGTVVFKAKSDGTDTIFTPCQPISCSGLNVNDLDGGVVLIYLG